MLQNHSRCWHGKGCGQHPSDEDYDPNIHGGSSSGQESVNDSEEDRRFFADFEGQSVFDWEELSVLSMYKENYERPWRQDSDTVDDTLEGEDAFSSRTEAWVASTAKQGPDPDDGYRDEHRDYYHDPEEEERRQEGLRMLLVEMRRRDSEEGWPLDEQMAALERRDREVMLQIMREELGWSQACKKKPTGKRKRCSMSMTLRNLMKTNKESPKQTSAGNKRRRLQASR